MLKRLLFSFLPIVYLMVYPIRAEDYFEKELREKLEVYNIAKTHISLFFNADITYENSFILPDKDAAERLKDLYTKKEYIEFLNGKPIEEVFIMRFVFVLSYREMTGYEKIMDRYGNLIMPGDYLILLPLQERYKGKLPGSMLFLYRKSPFNGGWKIVHSIFGT